MEGGRWKMEAKTSAGTLSRGSFQGPFHQRPVWFFSHLPSVFLKVGQKTQQPVDRGQDQQEDAGFAMDSEFDLDPVQSGKKLEEQQEKIDDPEY
jgi:hypothetical protein